MPHPVSDRCANPGAQPSAFAGPNAVSIAGADAGPHPCAVAAHAVAHTGSQHGANAGPNAVAVAGAHSGAHAGANAPDAVAHARAIARPDRGANGVAVAGAHAIADGGAHTGTDARRVRCRDVQHHGQAAVHGVRGGPVPGWHLPDRLQVVRRRPLPTDPCGAIRLRRVRRRQVPHHLARQRGRGPGVPGVPARALPAERRRVGVPGVRGRAVP